MTEVAEFPDIVEWLTGYLTAGLAANGYPSARVSDIYRGDKVEVWLQRDGGLVTHPVLEAPLVRVNCFHEGSTDNPVEAFAQRVSSLMRAAPRATTGPVKAVRQVVGPTRIDDLKPRRFMSFELTVKGSSLILS